MQFRRYARFVIVMTDTLRVKSYIITTHTRLTYIRWTAHCPGLPRWAGTRKVKPIWILLKQETVSGTGIRWDICKSRSRHNHATPHHHSVFYRPAALPATQPTASTHWRQYIISSIKYVIGKSRHHCCKQEAQLSPSDWAMRLVSNNLPITTQQCRNYLYDKSWPNRWYEVGGLVRGNMS